MKEHREKKTKLFLYPYIIFLFVLFLGWVFVHYCCSLEREALFHGKAFWSHKYDACQMAFIQNDVCLRGGKTNLTMSNLVGIDCYANTLCIVTSVENFERAEETGCRLLPRVLFRNSILLIWFWLNWAYF